MIVVHKQRVATPGNDCSSWNLQSDSVAITRDKDREKIFSFCFVGIKFERFLLTAKVLLIVIIGTRSAFYGDIYVNFLYMFFKNFFLSWFFHMWKYTNDSLLPLHIHHQHSSIVTFHLGFSHFFSFMSDYLVLCSFPERPPWMATKKLRVKIEENPLENWTAPRDMLSWDNFLCRLSQFLKNIPSCFELTRRPKLRTPKHKVTQDCRNCNRTYPYLSTHGFAYWFEEEGES